MRGCTLLKTTKIDLFILWLKNYSRLTPKTIWKLYRVQNTAVMPFRKAKLSHQRQKKLNFLQRHSLMPCTVRP